MGTDRGDVAAVLAAQTAANPSIRSDSARSGRLAYNANRPHRRRCTAWRHDFDSAGRVRDHEHLVSCDGSLAINVAADSSFAQATGYHKHDGGSRDLLYSRTHCGVLGESYEQWYQTSAAW